VYGTAGLLVGLLGDALEDGEARGGGGEVAGADDVGVPVGDEGAGEGAQVVRGEGAPVAVGHGGAVAAGVELGAVPVGVVEDEDVCAAPGGPHGIAR
jgi:hypothetical protein